MKDICKKTGGPDLRTDDHEGAKRVELHAHTKMSGNDGLNDVEELVKQAAEWGQAAVAITDHGVVQAFPDAADTAEKLAKKGRSVKIIYGMEGYLYPDGPEDHNEDGTIDLKNHPVYHIILLAANRAGLKNLYKLVSLSHLDYFCEKPLLPRSVIDAHREGLIIGSACEAGEVYRAVRDGKPEEELLSVASYYDYLEIRPLGCNKFMIEEGIVDSIDDLKNINLRILELGDRVGRMTVATTDSHYPAPEAAINRRIIMSGIGSADNDSGSRYLRTTDEMLEEFDYLGDRAEEVVIGNTNDIAGMIEDFKPLPAERYLPHIDGADETLCDICRAGAKKIYGDPLPAPVETRLERELSVIIGKGYAVIYVAARMLVQKSLSDGYPVGSRGSVGSSFAAAMAGITDVNPLAPHYFCPKCGHFEFSDEPEKYGCGFDMPDKLCPECGEPMDKDGLNIPFAAFVDFSGDREPDIVLNIAREYQSAAQRYLGEIFGDGNVFNAGTVVTIGYRTAYGYVRRYLEERDMPAGGNDIDRYLAGCEGVKRTTGQYPGGMIIVPDDRDIFDFSPLQRPADREDSSIITTHFDYHKIRKNLLKLDILGHDVLSMLRQLHDMTGVDPLTIRMDDPEVLSIFTSTGALGITDKNYRFRHGTIAIPEFDSDFVHHILDEIEPHTVSELIRISGFSHGTGVWMDNAEDLIRNGTAAAGEVISCRDDIINYLTDRGVGECDALRIMDDVRKNRELQAEDLKIMRQHGVPEWYIGSCSKIRYLFPRAHAAAYVMMAIRMAWYKVYFPAEFYSAVLTAGIGDFDIESAAGGIKKVEKEIEDIEALDANAAAKQHRRLHSLEVVYELFSRGLGFTLPKAGVSRPFTFIVVDGKINVPLYAVK